MSLSRAKWRDLLQKIKKGGIEELKKYSENVAISAFKQGYEEGHDNAVQGVKGNLLDAMDEVLRKNYGFRDKRIARFHEQLSNEILGITEDIKKQAESNTQLTIEDVA